MRTLKRLLLHATAFLVVFCSAERVSGQNDSIAREIDQAVEPKVITMAKARALLLDNLLAGDLEKVKQIKDYMVGSLNDEYHNSLSQQEFWIILYYTHEWDELSQSLLNYSYNTGEAWKVQPMHDMMGIRLGSIARAQHMLLEQEIQASMMESIKKDFLVLALRTILETSDFSLTELNQQEINLLATAFLKKYPESPYHDFVRRNVTQRFEVSPWGMEYEFSLGYGAFNQQLAQAFNDYGSLGFAFNGIYNNITLYGRALVGFSRTLRDISTSPTAKWPKRSQAGVACIDLSLGYGVINKGRWKISPFAGFGGVSIDANSDDKEKLPEIDDCDLKMNAAFVTGIVFDFNLSKAYNPRGNGFVRLRYSFHATDFTRQQKDMSGTIHNVTLGVSFGGRFSNRQYY